MAVEVTLFKLAPTADPDEFRHIARSATGHLRQIDGFENRELLHDSEQDMWIDVLHWQSRDHALRAADEMMRKPELAPFMQQIDPSSVQMLHGEPVDV